MKTILKKIEENLNNKNVYITNEDDVFYMTRFKSSNFSILFINGKWYGLTDPRYLEAATNEIEGMEIVNVSDENWLNNILESNKFEELYLNEADTTLKSFKLMEPAFSKKGITLKSFDYGYIRDAYLKEDLDILKEASKINDSLITKAIDYAKPGMAEKELESYILKLIIDAGVGGPSFEPIVVSGPNTSKPHGKATDRVIQEGELITIDMGIIYKGFCSDMTRTFSLGAIKDEEASKIWDMVLEATEACTELVKPGANCADVHNKAVEIFTKYGYEKYFPHGLGHGLGVEIHDKPAFNSKAKNDFLKPGMVMTVEPGLYISGKYGCRLENAVLVTEDGYEVLNKVPFTKEIK